MKKILAGLATATLLFGCHFSDDSSESAGDEPVVEIEKNETVLTDELFVNLSAEILCLPTNFSDASSDKIEISAQKILADAGVNEADFANYQKIIELNSEKKQEMSLVIVGKMSEFCSFGAVSAESDEPETQIEPKIETEFAPIEVPAE